MKKKGIFLPLTTLIILGGCSVGPDYKAPENTVSNTWASSSYAEAISSDTPIVQWWKVFNDPLLDKYITLATQYNKDVLTASSNILQARALRQIASSSFFPQLGADVNATKTYFSKNGPVFAIGPSTGSIPGTVSTSSGLPFDLQIPQTQSLYNALLDASWEIDIFGKTRRTVEAANALIGQSIEERNATLISIMAEIATNYMELRSSQKLAKLIQENIALLEEKAFLIQKQFECGYVSSLNDEEIKASLATERSLLPGVEAQIYKNIYTLSVLIGENPETLVNELTPIAPIPKAPDKIALGLRSDLLRRRPDVRRAERTLAAATAYVGVAVASFFPVFNLFGDGGLQSLKINNLFTMGSKTWALGGDTNVPIFQGGKLMGNLKAKRAETAAAATTYQQTVLTALQEAETAITLFNQDLKITQEKKIATDRYSQVVLLSNQRNAKGLVSLLELIDAKRQLNEADQSLLESELTKLLHLISLYKALGGGWETAF